jgi:hypothetical protein
MVLAKRIASTMNINKGIPMTHHPRWARHSFLPAVTLLAVALPGLAQAQLVLTDQSAAVFASSSAGTPSQSTSAAGDLSNLSLQVTSGPSTGTYAGANVRTQAGPDRIAFETYTWANAALISQSAYGYYYGSAQSSTQLSMAFSVLATTDVVMDVTDLYRPSYVQNQFPRLSTTLSFEKLGGDGAWAAVLPRNELDRGSASNGLPADGVSRLEAGQYRLNAVFNYSANSPSPLYGAGAKLSITAVPEPSTYALMGLGLFGLGLACRRSRTQQVWAP